MIARTRLAVVRAAVAELCAHGIAGADVGRIAVAAGVDEPVVRDTWPHPDELLREALEAALAGLDTGGADGLAAHLRQAGVTGLLASLVDASWRAPFWAEVLAGVVSRMDATAGDAAPGLVYRALVAHGAGGAAVQAPAP